VKIGLVLGVVGEIMYICTLMPAPSDRELPMSRPVPVLDGQSPESHCLHCEKPLVPTDDPLLGAFARVLCPECRRVPGYRRLYRKRVGWTQGWELHLRILTQRAKAEERLFLPKDPHPELSLPYKRRRKRI